MLRRTRAQKKLGSGMVEPSQHPPIQLTRTLRQKILVPEAPSHLAFDLILLLYLCFVATYTN